MAIPSTTDILRHLVAFPTVSRSSNADLTRYARAFLASRDCRITSVAGESDRENLWITIGPDDVPGVVLSGHGDVVPVAGQCWTRPPFQLGEEQGRLYGRGTADMKGFLAAALRCAWHAGGRRLRTPLHLAISYDEEIGCVGVRSLLDALVRLPVRPQLCWVGEPTSMRLALGHKGKVSWRATCHGREAHSAFAPHGLNAIHLATDAIDGLRALQKELAAGASIDHDHDIPYSTIHVGTIRGGEALNIVPARCTFDFELRNVAQDDIAAIEARIRRMAARIVAPLRSTFAEADIVIERMNAYPGLDTRHEGARAFMTGLIDADRPGRKVAFGTEGGLFSESLGVPTVICGPGSMEQGHKPDEFVTREQLDRCDQVLDRLLDRLEAGVAI